MKVLYWLLATLPLVSANPEWNEFKAKHGRKYEDAIEEGLRKRIFLMNVDMVERFNHYNSQKMGYRLGINHLSDRTSEELERLNGARKPEIELKNTPEAEAFFETVINRPVDVPDSLDWRKEEGRVSEVQDQGDCGSCWAFSAAGALEGQMKVRNTSFQTLSSQNLVDCSDNNSGCWGGWMSDAWTDIAQEGGIESLKDYNYTGRDDECAFEQEKAVFNDNSYFLLKYGDENMLKETVAKFGPVSVAVDASNSQFQHYQDGVFHLDSCEQDYPNHAILVVGYGSDPRGSDYWIVKNSWDKSWGKEGYILMARNRNNNCGIASHAMIPTFLS